MNLVFTIAPNYSHSFSFDRNLSVLLLWNTMIYRVLPFILLALFVIGAGEESYGQAWRSTYYPTNWVPPATANFYTDAFLQDYSYAGYQRGEVAPSIPNRTVYDVTLSPYNADKTGNTDATAAIQAAINAAQNNGGGIVFLPAGTYQVNPGSNSFCLRILRSNVYLKGAGIGRTFIFNNTYTMKGKSIISVFGNSGWSSTPTSRALITFDIMNPVNVLPVDNPSMFQTGDMVIVRNYINDNWITEHKEPNWLGFGSNLGGLMYCRTVKSVDVVNKTITVDIPVRYALKTRDGACVYKISGMISEVGLSDFSIGNRQHPATSGFDETDHSVLGTGGYDCDGSFVVRFNGVANCWMKNVSTYKLASNTTGAHMLSNGVLVSFSKNVTIDSCAFRFAQYGGGNGNGYAYRVSANETMISNSTTNFVRHGLVFSSMYCSGNVFYKCKDIRSGMQCGSTGSERTDGYGSDHHMHFSQSNLIDNCYTENSGFYAYYRPYGSDPKHRITATHTAYWNISSGGSNTFCVWTQQSRFGYVIGTSGTGNAVRTIENAPGTAAITNPVDIVQGTGDGGNLVPQSLYFDQLGKRLSISTNCTTPSPLVNSFTYCQNTSAAPLSATGVSLKWYTTSVGGLPLAGAPVPVTSLVGIATFFVSQTRNGCEGPRARLAVTVTGTSIPTVTISSSLNAICSGAGVVFSATGNNLGSAPSYTWFRNASIVGSGAGLTFRPSQGDVFRALVSVGGIRPACLYPTTVLSSVITLTVNGWANPGFSIASSSLSVCSGVGVTFTAVGTNGGSVPTITWFRNQVPVATGNQYSFIPSQGDAIRATLSAGGILPVCLAIKTVSSGLYTVTVNSIRTSTVSIAGTTFSVCSGTGISLTATGTNLGSLPTFYWYVNNILSSTGRNFEYTPADNDFVQVMAVASGSGLSCTVGSPVQSSLVLNVDPIVFPSLHVSASANPVCSGTGVLYTALPKALGSKPSFQWFVNGVPQTGTSSLFGFTPAHADNISVLATVGGTLPSCLNNTTATAAMISQVNATIPTTIAIFTNSTSVCRGTSISFTSTATGTGNSPIVTWFVNQTLAQTGNTTFAYVPTQGDVVSARVVAGGTGNACIVGGSATSTGLAVHVNSTLTSGLTMFASQSTLCEGSPIVCTAVGTNAGSNPRISWFINGQLAGNGKTLTYIPTNNDIIKATMAIGTGINCVTNPTSTSNGISVTVLPQISPSVAIQSNYSAPVCSSTGVMFTATGTNVGSNPTYTWFVNGIANAVGKRFNFTPSDGDYVSVTVSIGGIGIGCANNTTASANTGSLGVKPWFNPSISILQGVVAVCEGSMLTFTASGVSVGSLPTYSWYVNGSLAGQGQEFQTALSPSDSIYALVKVDTTISVCFNRTHAKSNTLRPNLIIKTYPSLNVNASQRAICPGNTVEFTVTGIHLGTLPTYQWMVNGNPQGIGNTFSYSPSDQDQINAVGFVGGQDLFCTDTFPVTSDDMFIQVIPFGEAPCIGPQIGTITGLQTIDPSVNMLTYAVANISQTQYQWTLPHNMTIVSGQGTNTITVQVSGTVAGWVRVTASNTFGSTSDSIEVYTVTITELMGEDVPVTCMVFPNPSQSVFLLDLNSPLSSKAQVEITDMRGLTVYKMDNLTLPAKITLGDQLPSGVYILHISQLAKKHSQKLIKL